LSKARILSRYAVTAVNDFMSTASPTEAAEAAPAEPSADIAESSPLQPSTTCDDGRTEIVGRVRLAFAHPVVEEDFLRFTMRGRKLHLLLACAVFFFYGASQLVVGRNAYIQLIHGFTAGTALLSFVLFTALVVVPGRDPAAREAGVDLRLARRAEAIITYVLCGISGAIGHAGTAYVGVATCAADGDDERCHYYTISGPIGSMVLVVLWARPRVKLSAAICVLYAVAFLAGQAAVGAYRAVDYAAAVVLLLTAVVVSTIQAVAAERRERQHFVDHVRLIRAEEKLAGMMAHTKDILRSAMPPELLNDDLTLAATTHRSDCATVGMSDICDFAQWSCGLLLPNVVRMLHMLLTMCDVGASEHGVVRAMTYGDCYVVCGGLIEPCDDHSRRVLEFEQWLLDATAGTMPIRAGVCTGPLLGQIAGDAAFRYVVSGPALESARAAVAVAATGRVVVCDDAPAPVLDATASPHTSIKSDRSKSATQLYGSIKVSIKSEGSAATDLRTSHSMTHHAADDMDLVAPWSPDDDGNDVGPPTFSALWLSFDTPASRAGFSLFMMETEVAVGPFIAVTPPCVFGAFLLVMLLELASPDPRRHHADNQLAMVGLAAATAIGVIVFVARLGKLPIYVSVLYAATALSLATGMISLIFTDCVFAAAHWYVALLLGVPGIFLRLPWLAQTALQFVTVIVPVVVYISQYYPYANNTAVNSVFVMSGFLVARYFIARVACRQYAAATIAAVAIRAATSKAHHQELLLLGLLPPHAVAHAGVTGEPTLRADRLIAPTYIENWVGLSALELSVHTWRSERGRPPMAEVWRCVAAALDDGEGLLEMTQATGDAFLVAGPFVKRGSMAVAEHDRLRQRTAQRAVEVARELAHALKDVCCFTAVLTAGAGCGALLGASLLSFRLLGPITRESHALLAAAPQTATRSAAFASTGFRQQHRNFVPSVNHAATFSDAGMSLALRQSHVFHTDVDKVAGGTLRASTAALGEAADATDAETFGQGTRWRVRGVGVAVVHQVVFPAACFPAVVRGAAL
jgi:class 3 adenylate cyclase